LVLGVALAVVGCGPSETGKAAKATEKKESQGGAAHNYKGRDWCVEHGMPESICVQCDASLEKKYRDKGDWCAEHDVPKSQCFKCDPKLKDKFAQEYRDKYGEDPPAPDEDEKEKKAKE
jgi:cobalt-zinc-cadmium efflux system membrane fusion protein